MLKESLIECGAIKFGKFKLTSGKESSYYVDIKQASTNPKVLHEIATEMGKLISNEPIELLAGMELGDNSQRETTPWHRQPDCG